MTDGENNNPSRGYAPNWRDTTEYIEDITYRIWEQGDIDFIKATYAKTCPIYTLASCFDDCDVVVKNTKSVLTIFPDRTLYPECMEINGESHTTINQIRKTKCKTMLVFISLQHVFI